MAEIHVKLRGSKLANLAVILICAVFGVAAGCSTSRMAGGLPTESNAAAIQRDGARLLAHLWSLDEDVAKSPAITVDYQPSKGDGQ